MKKTTLLLSLLLASAAFADDKKPAKPAKDTKKPSIEICFVLDTTGSMSGLIAGAKQKIWSVANMMISGKPTPKIKIGLIGYRDKTDAYITKTYPLSEDIDDIYAKLTAFQAQGGGDTPEAVNQALHEAVHKMKWSKSRDVLKIIFLVGDAPPHMDYKQDVKYPVTCEQAAKADIIINTIQCGRMASTTPIWKEIAGKAEGKFNQILQDGGVLAMATPFDKEIARHNVALNATVTGYGTPTGDLGGDGNLDILDLISLINIILGQSPTPVPGSQDFQAADLTGDGALNILDIVDLVNLILNPSPPAKTIAHITATVYVGLDPVQTLENRRQRVPVSLKTDAPVAGLQMTVRYDPSAIRLLEPEPTDRLGDLTMEWSNIEGVMQILIYSTTGQPIQPGQTHIVFIPVDVLTQEATLTLDQFIAANPQAGTLPVTITTGQLRVSTFPTVFSLGTNRPNPFNPSTTIAFDVPQVAHITLTIYNVLGQEVIRLIDEQRSPGRYEVAWNGRNAQGAGVSTGIYMYRLTSSTGFAEAKRMTLLK